MDKKTLKIYGAALLFSVLVGFTFIGVKVITEIGTTLEILTYRYNFAFLGTAVLVIFGSKKMRFKAKDKKNLAYTAIFYILFMVLQAAGLVYTTSIVSGIIFSLIPIIAKVIASVYLGEQTTGLQNLFVLISVSALIVMILLDAKEINTNVWGILLLLLSSTAMAISNVFMRFVRKSYTPLEISFAISLLGFAAFNLVTLVLGLKNGSIMGHLLLSQNLVFMVASAYLGIFCTLLTSFLMSYSLAHLEAVKATMFGNLSTAISLIAGAILLSEPLKYYHVLCTLLIIIGVAGVSVFGKKRTPETH